MSSTERPSIVTYIGWILIVTSVLPLLTTIPILLMGGDTMEDALSGLWVTGCSVHTLLLFSILLIAAGIGILNGLNWGRMLLFVVWPIRFVILPVRYAFWTGDEPVMAAIPMIAMGAAGYVFCVITLTRTEASAYFQRHS